MSVCRHACKRNSLTGIVYFLTFLCKRISLDGHIYLCIYIANITRSSEWIFNPMCYTGYWMSNFHFSLEWSLVYPTIKFVVSFSYRNNLVIKMHSDKNCVVIPLQQGWTFYQNDTFSLNFKSLLWYQPISPNATFQASGKMKFTKEQRVWIIQVFASTKVTESISRNFGRMN